LCSHLGDIKGGATEALAKNLIIEKEKENTKIGYGYGYCPLFSTLFYNTSELTSDVNQGTLAQIFAANAI